MSEVDLKKYVDLGLSMGADYVELRFEDLTTEYIVHVNGRIKEIGSSRTVGIGIRVLVDGHLGFSATDGLSRESLKYAINEAISAAKSTEDITKFSGGEIHSKSYIIPNIKVHPLSISWEEKVKLVSNIYMNATDVESAIKDRDYCPKDVKIKNVTIRYVSVSGIKHIVNSEGIEVNFKPLVTGIAISVVSARNGILGDGYVTVGGSIDYKVLLDEIYSKVYDATWKSIEKTIAKPPKPYEGTVIVRPEVTGLFAHESFGHMSEGDFVASGSSPLKDMLGSEIASEHVTIVDSGVVNYKYGIYLPVDDEGVTTQPVRLVDKGIDSGFLHSRISAAELGVSSTGNGRAQSHRHMPIVRMRNTFFEQGDWSEEEMIRECKSGILVDDGRGGQAELDGTFTFSASRGYIIEKGEIKEPIRDIILTGNILEMLKHVRGSGKEVLIDAAPFGGCGKGGQSVYVGIGGPTLLVDLLRVGGRVG